MNSVDVPFSRQIGIRRNASGLLELPFNQGVQNHLATVHAGAQFALAETASGDLLAQSFPDLVGKVIPILREAQVQFRKPGLSALTAHPILDDAEKTRFTDQMNRKGRALIQVQVTLVDEVGEPTCRATYGWFVQLATET